MLVPDAVVPEDEKLALAVFGVDANSAKFCAGRMADALTFVSFPTRIARPARESHECGSTEREFPTAMSSSFERGRHANSRNAGARLTPSALRPSASLATSLSIDKKQPDDP
jgi:hypothetical protein